MKFPTLIIILLIVFSQSLIGAVTPEELEEREARLTTHLKAFAGWVDDVCDLSDEQQDQLNERIKQAVTKSQQAYQFPDFPNQIKTQQSRLYDYSPIRFVGIRGAAWGVFQAGLNDELQKILNEAQKEKYRAAMEKRKQTLHQYFLAQVINTADRELFLTDQQKEAIKNLFPEKLPLLDNGLYSFYPKTSYLNEKSIDVVLFQASLGLNKTQMKWLEYLRKNRKQAVMLNAVNEDDMQGKISAEVQKQMEELVPAMELRITYFSRQFQLSKENLQYLKLAAKGTTVKLMNRWKEEAITQQQNNAVRAKQDNQQPTYRILLPPIRIHEFDDHPLWEQAVRKVITDSVYEKRKMIIQQTTLNYLIALLDQELWLSSEHRIKITTMYHDVSIFDRNRYCQNLIYSNSYDLSLLAAVLTGKRQGKLNGILNDSQLNALSQLKKQFPKNKNLLRIKTRRGRKFLGYMKAEQENAIQFFSGGGYIGGGGFF